MSQNIQNTGLSEVQIELFLYICIRKNHLCQSLTNLLIS